MLPVLDALSHMKSHFPEAHASVIGKLRVDVDQITWSSRMTQSLLSTLAECLTIPSCTVAICASFRPVLIDVVSRCLRRCATQDTSALEAVAFAMAHALRVSPNSLLNTVLAFFRSREPQSIFDRVSPSLDEPSLLRISQTAHTLLKISHRFSSLWCWSPLMQLVSHRNHDVAYHAAAAMALYLGMSDEERRKLEPLNRVSDRLADVMDTPVLAEAFEWNVFSPEPMSNDAALQMMTAADLSDDVVSLCGVLLPRSRRAGPPVRESSKLVYTDSAVRNLQAVALALSRGKPVLVAGDTGAGKSCLIAEVARITGNTDMMSIHLGDQTDAKVLLGSYVCTDVPGEFRWQPGALTQAVVQGLWVLIEDVDLAPLDVMSVLIPLLESRKLFIPGRGEEIIAADGFQLFATQNLSGGRRNAQSANLCMSGLWTRVVIEHLSSSELCQVMSQLYPGLTHHAETLVGARDKLVSRTDLAWFLRSTSARDVKKWFHRVCVLHPALNSNIKKPLSLEGKLRVFHEGLDCFLSMIPDCPNRAILMTELGQAFQIPSEMIEQQLVHRKPEIAWDPTGTQLRIGRSGPLARLGRFGNTAVPAKHRSFVQTKHALRVLERVAVCVSLDEPVLLVGETGVGKTAAVQCLADLLGHELVVVNLNQQSDSSDLLGSYRPLEMRLASLPVKRQFEQVFSKSFSQSANKAFLDQVDKAFEAGDWKRFLRLLRQAEKLRLGAESEQKKRKVNESLKNDWLELSRQIQKLESQQQQMRQSFAFSFVEGSLVDAVRHGHWILLDEINLGSSEMLESISGLLEGESILLTERGDTVPIPRHPNFRLFACMNPSTNVGRKDLPPALRNRFSEFFVDECVNHEDLVEIVLSYLPGVEMAVCSKVVKFYLAARGAANTLRDGAGRSPKFSLRSLVRALEYARQTRSQYGLDRSLYEGFCMTFLTQLDLPSQEIMSKSLRATFPPGNSAQLPSQPPSEKPHVRVQHFWIEVGDLEPSVNEKYILTRTITKHLKNLARIVVTRRYPALLQGPTAAGKTSMVEYLARMTGHRFVRINNHEHTDISEYMGSYVSDEHGRLVFKEGVLVEAVRKGYWIVLDELNLAPSEVLESLNRLLDDNRELFIPETQEVLKPHPHFALFATQNPPGLYGGRKTLSPAFRNRFLELHFDDLPNDELQEILQRRCSLAPSYCAKLVEVMRDLQRRRQSSQVFAGKHGFITLRDLFKWAERQPVGYQQLAEIGYMLLAERLRSEEEKVVIRQVMETHFNGARVDAGRLYHVPTEQIEQYREALVRSGHEAASRVVWTESFQRMFCLVRHCVRNKEPVLLIGETGCGKTSVVQVIAALMEQELRILNLHEHSETADFLGGLRPLRDRATRAAGVFSALGKLFSSAGHADKISSVSDVQEAIRIFKQESKKSGTLAMIKASNSPLYVEAKQAIADYETLFQWYDGPLVESMKQGHYFLLDEISLAEDAVLERLNSILESGRSILLAEKGGTRPQELRAHSDFRILATMNPGGDFGKRELSPALRNRFTEIWVPAIDSVEDVANVIRARLGTISNTEELARLMMDFGEVLKQEGVRLNLRDFLSWADFFVTAPSSMKGSHTLGEMFLHGACLICLDGLAVSSARSANTAQVIRQKAIQFIEKRLSLNQLGSGKHLAPSISGNMLQIGPFVQEIWPGAKPNASYLLDHGTVASNLLRLMRGCTLKKPILIEGSPGQGKTTMVIALAKQLGRNVVRINLSEETDMMDLLGADLPVEGGTGGQFQWQDGVFLQALKRGDWVLLDELNLASQSILEGLNSVLDHRESVFVPELNATFHCPPSFRIFACQNPTVQGGGRKSLPKSFLNRFTKVYMDAMSADDMMFIVSSLYPHIEEDHVASLIRFNERMFRETMVNCAFGMQGRPWEFNLRDILRCCDLYDPLLPKTSFFSMLYKLRFRSQVDRDAAEKVFKTYFPDWEKESKLKSRFWSCAPSFIQIGHVTLPRKSVGSKAATSEDLLLIKSQLPELEAMAQCVSKGWMPILVGPQASGKTSLVHLLARLTGNELHTFEMNAGIDTTELLGGFEQLDLAHHRREFLSELDELISAVARQHFVARDDAAVRELLQLRRSLGGNGEQESSSTGGRSKSFNPVEEAALKKLLSLTQAGEHLRGRLDLIQRVGKKSGAQFEWRDGFLIHALEKGSWLLIDNVNFCNPAVLDRLNPLLEPNGELLVNERGLVDGKVRVVVPHPNFRIFLAMDPKNGEISRAMRNRGIEICVLPPSRVAHDDFMRMAARRSQFEEWIVPEMAKFHDILATDPECATGLAITVRDFLSWVDFFYDMRRRGSNLTEALKLSMEHVYVRNRRVPAQRVVVLRRFEEFFRAVKPQKLAVPRLPDVRELSRDSVASHVASDSVLCAGDFVDMFFCRASIHDHLLRQHLVPHGVSLWNSSVFDRIRQTLNHSGDVWRMMDAREHYVGASHPSLVSSLVPMAARYLWLFDKASGENANQKSVLGRSKMYQLGQLKVSDLNSEQELVIAPLIEKCDAALRDSLSLVEKLHVRNQMRVLGWCLVELKLMCQNAALNRAELSVLWRQLRKQLDAAHVVHMNDSLKDLVHRMDISMSGQDWELQSTLAKRSRGLAPRSTIQAVLAMQLLELDRKLEGRQSVKNRKSRLELMDLGAIILGAPFESEEGSHATSAKEVLDLMAKQLDASTPVGIKAEHEDATGQDDGQVVPIGHDIEDLIPLCDVMSMIWQHGMMSVAWSKADVDTFCQWSASNSGRRPVDMTPYRVLNWVSQVPFDQRWVSLSRECEEELEFRWLSRCFSSSLSFVPGMADVGSLLLFRDVPALLVSSVSDVADVPLNLARTKSNQLALLYRNIMQSRSWSHDSKQAEIVRMQKSCSRMFSAFEKFCLNESDRAALSDFPKAIVDAVFLLSDSQESLKSRVLKGVHTLSSFPAARMKKVCELILAPMLEELTSSDRHPSLWVNLAKAWIYLGLARLYLLAPACPVDPSARHSIRASLTRKRVNDTKSVVETRAALERFVYGGSDSVILRELENDLSTDLSRLKEIDAKVQSRVPNAPNFSLLFKEIDHFVKSFGDYKRIRRVVDDLVGGDWAKGSAAERQFQGVSQKFLSNMESTFDCYRDVTVPIATSVLDIKFGFALLVETARGQNVHVASETALVKTLLSCGGCGSVEETFTTLLLSQFVNKSVDISGMGAPMFKALLAWADLAVSDCKGIVSDRLVKSLDILFAAFSKTWATLVEKERKAKEEAESTVKYKKTSVTIETDEEKDERMYAQMFPSFSDAFAELAPEDMAADFAAGAAVIEEPAKPAVDTRGMPLTSVLLGRTKGSMEEHLLEVCNLHARVFRLTRASSSDVAKDERMLSACSSSYSAAVQLMAKSPSCWLYDGGKVPLEWHLFAVGRARESLHMKPLASADIERKLAKGPASFSLFEVGVSSTSMDASKLSSDIYRTSNPMEGRLVLEPLLGMEKKVRQFLDEWPEHAVLMQVLKCIQVLLNTSWNEPLMKLLKGLEYLMYHAQQWEQNAASHVSLEPYLGDVGRLVLRWRKLELLSWPAILASRVQVHELSAMKNWFHLEEIIHAVPARLSSDVNNDEKIIGTIVDKIVAFVREATLGDFRARLAILSAFADQLEMERELDMADATSPRSRVGLFLRNAHSFFHQYLEVHEEVWKSNTKELDQQIKEFLKLIKWDSSSYIRLEESAEKSKRKVSKFAKKMDEILRLPMGEKAFSRIDSAMTDKSEEPDQDETAKKNKGKVEEEQDEEQDEQDAWSRWIPDFQESQARFLVDASVVPPETLESTYTDLGLGESSRVRRIPSLVKRMQGAFQESIFPVVNGSVARDLEEMSEALIEGVKALQGENVEMKQKRLAFQQLLKTLKEKGMSWRNATFNVQQQSLAYVLQTASGVPRVPEALKKYPLADFVQAGVDRAERYVWKIASRMIVLRKLAEAPSPDLDRRQVQLCIGYAENLFGISMTGRDRLLHVIQDLSVLDTLFQSLKRADYEKLPKQQPMPSKAFSVWKALRAASRVIQFQSFLGAEMSDTAHPWMEKLLGCRHHIDRCIGQWTDSFALRKKGNGLDGAILWTDLEVDCLNRSVKALGSFVEAARAVPEEMQSASVESLKSTIFYCEEVLQQVRDQSAESTVPMDTCSSNVFEDLVDALLVSVQGVVRNLAEARQELSERSNQWKNIASGLGVARIVREMRNSLQAIALGRDMEDSSWSVVGVSLAPLVHQTMLISWRWVVEQVCEWSAFSKFGYVFTGLVATLLEKGFCNSQPDDDDNKGKSEFEFEDDVEGTGMGEGEGKKDVSKQIEDPEEQLMGTRDEKKEEGGNEKEEDDAIDMELDFEGTLHDMDSDDEEQEKDDEEKEDDEDREMGDMKQEDIVDEKMWDSSDDEEKEGGDEENQQQQETYEKDDSEKMQAGMDLELAAKQGDEEEAEKDEDQQDDEAKNKDQEEEEKEEEPFEEKEGGEPQGPQPQDEVIDKAANLQEPDDFQVPEEMEMSDASEKEEGGEEENEPMDVDKEDDGDADGEEEEQKGEENAEEKAQNAAEEEEAKNEENKEEEEEEEEDKPKSEEEDAKEGEEQQPNQADGEEDEEDKKEEEGERGDGTNKRDDDDEDDAKYGVREKGAGAVEIQGEGEAGKDEDRDERNKHQGKGEKGEPDKKEKAGGGGNEGDGGEGPAAEGQGQARNREDFNEKEANPLRSLGDALKNFRKRILGKDVDDQEKQLQQQQQQPVDEDSGKPEAKDQEAEFTKEGKEQALATATDEQMQQQQQRNMKMMEDNDDEDLDEAAPMEESGEGGNGDDDVAASDKVVQKPDVTLPPPEMEVGDENRVEEKKDIAEPEETQGPRMARADRGFGALEEPEEEEEEGEADDDLLAQGLQELSGPTLDELREKFEKDLAVLHEAGSGRLADGEKLWRELNSITAGLSSELCEQLRLLLEPSRATQLVGDFRTGKRINMKRIIPYIASDFKKDKIWLRRKKPNKRNYQIMVAIDDSRSMFDHRKGQMALEALCTLCVALSTLEVGQVAVTKFGSDVSILHPFDEPWSDQSGARIFSQFAFDQADTHVQSLLSTIVKVMEDQKQRGRDSSENQQLAFIISDGLLASRGAQLAKLVSECAEKGILLVFILIDNQGEEASSVLDIQSIIQTKSGKMTRKLYLDQFPFPYYVVLKNINNLPHVLADALRQWIELSKSMSD